MALLTPPLFAPDENLDELHQRIAAVRHARRSVAAAMEDQQYVEEVQALIDGGAVHERWSAWDLSFILEALDRAELTLPNRQGIETFHSQWLDVFERKNEVTTVLYNWAVVGECEDDALSDDFIDCFALAVCRSTSAANLWGWIRMGLDEVERRLGVVISNDRINDPIEGAKARSVLAEMMPRLFAFRAY